MIHLFMSSHRKLVIIVIGICATLFLGLVNPLTLEPKASIVLAIGVFMIYLWVTDAIPMPIVSVIPILLFPLLKIHTLEETCKAYANPVIFLFFGGFILGLAIEKWHLHKRIALSIIKLTGTKGDSIIFGFILATGLLSMWLSNTATTMMMYPIALSVIAVVSQHHQPQANYQHFNMAIMLAIAYASNIGGIATIIGTPPNVAYIGYFQSKYHQEVDFVSWMLVCTPLSILLLLGLYLIMVKWLYPSNIQHVEKSVTLLNDQLEKLGKITKPEKRVLAVFIITATLWIMRSLLNSWQTWIKLDDTIIAIFSAILLFVIPTGIKNRNDEIPALLQWEDTSKMAWGILLLFGGGICLAEALEKVGLIQILGAWLSNSASNLFLLILLITIISIFISEVMSNVAQVIVFAPVVSVIADNLSVNPLLLGIPMTLAASCAGMLPMGTPPNAIVFASNYIKMSQMIKVGFIMNIIAIVLITIFAWYILPLVFL